MASQTPADGQGSTAIDDDVLYEILLRLPAKPLCRLRAVCQSWRSLLSAPSFITAHKAREAALLLVVREDAGSAVNVHILDILSGKSVRQIRIENNSKRSPDSLVLMRPPHDLPLVRLPSRDSEGLRLRVLDLATGTDFTLPDDVDHDKQQPHCASFMVGRASTGAYKVLCIRSTLGPNADGQQLCRVLTLSGNLGWRDTGCPPAKVGTCRQDGAAVKGVAYFLLSTIRDPGGSNECIVAYDLEKEAWRPASLSAPAPSNNLPRNMFLHSLVELGGCLAILYEDWYNTFKELWLLVDPDKVIWYKRCTITVPYRYHGVEESLPRRYFAQILWLLDDGRIVIWMLVSGLAPSRVLCVYDPRTMTYTDVAHMPNYMLGCVYTGSLLGLRRFSRILLVGS